MGSCSLSLYQLGPDGLGRRDSAVCPLWASFSDGLQDIPSILCCLASSRVQLSRQELGLRGGRSCLVASGNLCPMLPKPQLDFWLLPLVSHLITLHSALHPPGGWL